MYMFKRCDVTLFMFPSQHNYQRSLVERQERTTSSSSSSKPRKKTKQSALTRPTKKGRKRRKSGGGGAGVSVGGLHQTGTSQSQVLIGTDSMLENCLDLPSSDTEKGTHV